MSTSHTKKSLSIRDFRKMKKNKQKIAMLTAYDTVTAKIFDESGIDILLVGDSMNNVVLGQQTTLNLRFETLGDHVQAVSQASQRAFVVADLPFGSFQVDLEESVKAAIKMLSEFEAHGVKLEGASEYIIKVVDHMVSVGIPVMGHIGLTPQYIHQMGGFYTHGKTEKSKKKLLEQAVALEKAGCFSLVLECVEENLAEEISQQLRIPCIGIGSGQGTDGQVLVANDVLGYHFGHTPSFAKQYIDLKPLVEKAAKEYLKDVKG